jgi:hypothetical protein
VICMNLLKYQTFGFCGQAFGESSTGLQSPAPVTVYDD